MSQTAIRDRREETVSGAGQADGSHALVADVLQGGHDGGPAQAKFCLEARRDAAGIVEVGILHQARCRTQPLDL